MLLYYPGSTGTISVFIFTFLDSDVLGVCVCPTQVMHAHTKNSFLHQLNPYVPG